MPCARAISLARVSVDDPDSYALYAKGAFAAMQKYGARILARGGRSEALEGEARARNVILEFESYDQAKKYFTSPEYQEARRHRAGGVRRSGVTRGADAGRAIGAQGTERKGHAPIVAQRPAATTRAAARAP